MISFKVGDKIKLVKSHYLFNDWAVNKSGVVIKSIVNREYKTYKVEIEKRSIWVEGLDIQLDKQKCNSGKHSV